jgi:hypothetical protein
MQTARSQALNVVSANVARTAQRNRQAVLDAKRAVDWLDTGLRAHMRHMGTSLGSMPGDARDVF